MIDSMTFTLCRLKQHSPDNVPHVEPSIQHGSEAGAIQPTSEDAEVGGEPHIQTSGARSFREEMAQKTVELPQFQPNSAAVANQAWTKAEGKQLSEQGSQKNN